MFFVQYLGFVHPVKNKFHLALVHCMILLYCFLVFSPAYTLDYFIRESYLKLMEFTTTVSCNKSYLHGGYNVQPKMEDAHVSLAMLLHRCLLS